MEIIRKYRKFFLVIFALACGIAHASSQFEESYQKFANYMEKEGSHAEFLERGIFKSLENKVVKNYSFSNGATVIAEFLDLKSANATKLNKLIRLEEE